MKYLVLVVFFFFFFKKRKYTPLLMCHLSSEGGFTVLVKEQAADLDQKFIYNYNYRGIVITTHVLKKYVKRYST